MDKSTIEAKLYELAYAKKIHAYEASKRPEPVQKQDRRGDWKPVDAARVRREIREALSSEPITATKIAAQVEATPHRVRVILRAMLDLGLAKQSGPANKTTWTIV